MNEGEIVGLLGPNGAGKTTTMNILTGYLSCDSGRALIDGIDILENPREAKKRIGFLPEQPPLYLDMTVLEYLNFIYDLKGCTLHRQKHLEEICEVTVSPAGQSGGCGSSISAYSAVLAVLILFCVPVLIKKYRQG